MFNPKWRAAFWLATLALLTVTWLPEPGVTWDEPTYVSQGVQYVGWIRRFLSAGADGEDPVWTTARPDHPPLGKLAYGLVAVSPPATRTPLMAARLSGAVFFATLIWLTTYGAHRAFGERVAWLAGTSLLLTPQVLAHAQFAALDLPVTVTWVAAATVSFAGPTRWRGAVAVGFLWGLGLLTKVNAVFLAGPLVLWGVASRRLRWRELPVLAAVAALTFWLGWPWLWNDTATRLSTYLLDKQIRWVVPTYYLGETYADTYPPWHYPLLLIVATLPPGVFVGAVVGVTVLARRRSAAAGWVALHLAFTLGVACVPGVPRYDGTRLFLPAFPFLAIIAGVGLERLLQLIVRVTRAGTPAAAAALILVTSWAVSDIVRAAPCLLSAYSTLIGGVAGAERLGLETTFWGDAVTPELLSAVPVDVRVGAVPMGIDYVRTLQRAGLLPKSNVAAPEDQCDVLIILGRKSMLKGEFRQRFDDDPGLTEVRRDGVVLAKLVSGTRAR